MTLTAYDAESAAVYSRAAVSLGRTARVHLKLDTGMSRLGLNAWEGEETLARALAIARLPGIRVEGAFTHFAVADEPDKREQTQRQLTLFTGLCDQIRRAGVPLRFAIAPTAPVCYNIRTVISIWCGPASFSTATRPAMRCRCCPACGR